MTELRQRWEREKAALLQEGQREGLLNGQVQTKAEAILTVLTTRGFPISERVRAQILGCRDLSILDRWLVRAVTAASESDVIAA